MDNKSKNRYKIITLCGSVRFKQEFIKVQEKLTLNGNIVFTPSEIEYAKEIGKEVLYLENIN